MDSVSNTTVLCPLGFITESRLDSGWNGWRDFTHQIQSCQWDVGENISPGWDSCTHNRARTHTHTQEDVCQATLTLLGTYRKTRVRTTPQNYSCFPSWLKTCGHVTPNLQVNLSPDAVTKLFDIFHRMDNDHSTSVEVIEFLTFFDLDRSAFALKAFSVMDFDGSGSINFFEFALSTWNYCTLTTKNLEVFAFDLYDSDGSGWSKVNRYS